MAETCSQALDVSIEHLNQLNVGAQQESPGAPEGAAAHAPPLVLPLWVRKKSKEATVHTRVGSQRLQISLLQEASVGRALQKWLAWHPTRVLGAAAHSQAVM